MEIERKYLISSLPEHLEQYPHRQLEQGYLSTSPVVRVTAFGDAVFHLKAGVHFDEVGFTLRGD